MSKTTKRHHWAGRAFVALAGFVAIAAVALLTSDVAREMKLLQSAQSDNVQWALSQTEVEFLELKGQTSAVPVDVVQLRRRFDIFYSRITIIQSASVFESIRADPDFYAHLIKIRSFLDANVDIIDQPDAALRGSTLALDTAASAVRADVRSLSNLGLNSFATASDLRRDTVAQTMMELAAVLVVLIGALGLGVVYLNRINARGRSQQTDLRNAIRRINTITSTSLDGVIMSNSSGKILEFNPAAETIFGHLAEDVIGRDLGSIIIPDHLRGLHDAGMERMRQGGDKRVVGKGRVTLDAKHANGNIFPVELAIQSAETNEGEIFIAFLRDISARAAAENELVEARDKALVSEKLKTEFITTMSHEIRTPLNGLLGNMTLLRDTSLNTQQARYMGNMETSGRLLMSHVSDILDISRYDAGMLSIQSKSMNISLLLQDIIDNQSGVASANETALEWGWTGEVVNWIASDPDRLQHILINLIGNAVKFTKRGKVTVTVEAIDGDSPVLRFEVVDTGAGIDADFVPRIFDDFVTGNTAYNRDVCGTGMGLGIAKRFAMALGGDVGVESVLGKGSRFWVTLPLVQSEEVSQPSMEAEPTQNGPRMDVLVVEDNEINRVIVRDMLEGDGHTVTEAVDGRDGVQAASIKRFDLILMDISMPVMDGRATTREIRGGTGPNAYTVIIALTANVMVKEQESFLEDGMNGILTKPLSRTALRDVLSGAPTIETEVERVILDLSHVADTREAAGADAFEMLLGRFSDETEALVEWLKSGEATDLPEIAARTHNVAGTAAVFGAVDLREALKAIEVAGKSDDAPAVAKLIDALPAQWQRTKRALRELL